MKQLFLILIIIGFTHNFFDLVNAQLSAKVFTSDKSYYDRSSRNSDCYFSYSFYISGCRNSASVLYEDSVYDWSCDTIGNLTTELLYQCIVQIAYDPVNIESKLSITFIDNYVRDNNISVELVKFDIVSCGYYGDISSKYTTSNVERVDYQTLFFKLGIKNYNELYLNPTTTLSQVYQAVDYNNYISSLGFYLKSTNTSLKTVPTVFRQTYLGSSVGSFSINSYFTPEIHSEVSSVQTYPTPPPPSLGFQFKSVRQIISVIETTNPTDDQWVLYYTNDDNSVAGKHYVVNRDQSKNTSTIMMVSPVIYTSSNFIYELFSFSDGISTHLSSFDLPFNFSILYVANTPAFTNIQGSSTNSLQPYVLVYQLSFSTTFDPSQCYSSLIGLFNEPKIHLDFSYGIIFNSGSRQFTLKTSTLVPKNRLKNIVTTLSYFDILNVFSSSSYTSTNIGSDDLSPTLDYLSFLILQDKNILVQMKIRDDLSGVYMIEFKGISQNQVFYYYNSLVDGDPVDGKYEFILNSYVNEAWNSVNIHDAAGNKESYQIDRFVNNKDPSLLTQFPIQTWNSMNIVKDSDITFLQLEFPIVDSLNETFDNSLFVAYSGISSGDIVSITLNLPFGNSITSFGLWNIDLDMFVIDFTLPKFLVAGPYHYTLSINYNPIPSLMLYEQFPDARLQIINTIGSIMPPIVDSISFSPSSITISVNTIIKATIIIKDLYSGFKSGYVIVRGIDPIYFRFYLDPTLIKSGDKFYGIYELSIPIIASECVSQTLTVADAYLENEAGFISSSFDFTLIHPLYQFRVANTSTSSILLCPVPTFSLPTLSAFSVNTQSIDVVSNARQVSFNITLSSNGGMNSRQHPIVTLTTVSFERFFVNCHVRAPSLGLSYYYNCVGVVPYGFGFPDGMLISIDNIITGKSFSTSFVAYDLIASSYQYFIESIFNNQVPYITYVSPFDPISKSLTVSGVGLNQFASLDVILTRNIIPSSLMGQQQLRGLPTATAISGTSMYLIENLDIGTATNDSEQFSIQLQNTNGQSEPMFIVIPPNPIKIPLTGVACQGEPICGGPEQGTCQPNGYGCKCIYPWYSKDCTLKRLLIPQPTLNSSHPGFYSSVENSEKFKFDIQVQIVGLRELKFDGKTVVKQWKLNMQSWKYQDISTNSTTKERLYTFELTNGGLLTTINATIQWFSESELVEFGNQKFTVYPSTYKYKILMTNYAFQSKVNTLQLIFSSKIQGQPDCSSNEIGNGNQDTASYQYTKVQVNNMSVFGRFIKYGIIDGVPVAIENQDITNEPNSGIVATSSSQEVLMAVNIPSYNVIVKLDPDFSVLVDHSDRSNNDNELCTDDSSGGLTKTQLIGIIIGAVGFFIVLVIIISYFVYQKYKYSGKLLTLRNKLSSK